MLGWLKKLFGGSEPHDLYRPRERLIYSYWDGAKVVHCDPLPLYKKVMEVGPELSIDIKVAQSASKDAGKASEKMLEKIRVIFALKPFDQGGLTEVESLELFNHFMEFTERVKKNSRPMPTSAPTSVPSGPSTAAVPPTSSTSASGSTAPGPSTATPTPSPSASK